MKAVGTLLMLVGLWLVVGVAAAQEPTATPFVTPNPTQSLFEDEAEGYQPTAEALQSAPGITTDGQQVYDENGNPLLPVWDSPAMLTFFGYSKWALDANNTQSIFGPFAPIIRHMRIFLVLTVTWFAGYFGFRLLKLLLRFMNWASRNAILLSLMARVIIFLGIGFAVYRLLQFLGERFDFVARALEWITERIPFL